MSAYHLYGKPGNSGENSNRTVHSSGNFPEKNYTFRGFDRFPFLPKRPKFSLAVSLALILIHIDVELLYFLSFIYFVLRLCIF